MLVTTKLEGKQAGCLKPRFQTAQIMTIAPPVPATVVAQPFPAAAVFSAQTNAVIVWTWRTRVSTMHVGFSLVTMSCIVM